MRYRICALAAFLAAALWTGCSVVDPAPTTEGSMVSPKLASLPKPDPEHRKAVTVYEFRVNVPYHSSPLVGRGATDQFITALYKSGYFTVLERQNLRQLAAEKNLQRAGEATGSAGARKLVGADYIFEGAITELEETSEADAAASWYTFGLGAKQRTATVGMDIRIVDAGSGEVLDAIDVRKKVRAAGAFGAYQDATGTSGRAGARVSKALSLAIRECIEEAVYQIARNFGNRAGPSPR